VESVTGEYWNHNVHYQRVILDAVPERCQAAVDVGCGDGMLVRKLAARCGAVTGIDRDERIIGVARERGAAVPGVRFAHGDFLEYPFEEASLDFACANTALHHMDFGAALARMAWLLKPGGRLAVVGLANNGSPADWVIGGAGIPANLTTNGPEGKPAPALPSWTRT
jgi:ubiquinone/menaquinone biosynthesis C-methylase UbiE